MYEKKNIRALAIYLPQYHPIKENNEWWGEGFTEWTNVVKGKQVVKGQYQPHIPKDLGFYDLRVEETRILQAKLAKDYGIYGFCYYHYWFNGRRLLERPLNEVLASKKPDFPFCLCWANESWGRNWDGRGKEILMAQEYSEEDDINHIRYLCKDVFSDSRYIKVNGAPLFAVYRPADLPDINKTVALWRNEAKKMGYPDIYVIYFQSFENTVNPAVYGMDAAAMFTPVAKKLPSETNSLLNKVLWRLGLKNLRDLKKHTVLEYRELVDFYSKMDFPDDYTLFPSVTPMWDNYVRRRKKGATIFVNSTPELYKKWLLAVCKKWQVKNAEENFLFINAWNEWAEGNHLEPCERWGHQYLEATKEVLKLYFN